MANPSLRRLGTLAGRIALGLAALSSGIALTTRDAVVPTAMVFFGVPWLVRLVLAVAAWVLARPKSRKLQVLCVMVAVHSVIEAGGSFRWRDEPPTPADSFEITLWNVGRNIHKMSREWPHLAGPGTKLVVLIEAGSFSPDSWKQFTAAHPDFTWKRLDGGIVAGVKGKLLEVAPFGDRPRFRCHRIRVEIDGAEYSVLAVDIPSQPWLPRKPCLNRILDVSSEKRCMILGDFNTPPEARGFDAWRSRFSLANDAKPKGFRETWCYGLPVLTLDQLWLSKDLEPISVSQTVTLRSDHVRMTFRIRAR